MNLHDLLKNKKSILYLSLIIVLIVNVVFLIMFIDRIEILVTVILTDFTLLIAYMFYFIDLTKHDDSSLPFQRNNNSRIHTLLNNYTNADFKKLKITVIKSPAELIKEDTLNSDKILPFLTTLSQYSHYDDQINFARANHWTDIYPESWAEHEVELIGFYVIQMLEKYLLNEDKIDQNYFIKSVYDAGCANFGQYFAIQARANNENNFFSPNFDYYGQDLVDEWKKNEWTIHGKFFSHPLPIIEPDIKCDLVTCTHTFNLMEKNPIAIYTSFWSFNELLVKNGYCCISVPVKESQPGMLDFLEKAASDAKFKILESQNTRLNHEINKSPSQITTFSYLVLQKTEDIDQHEYEELLKLSLFRGQYAKIPQLNSIEKYKIPDWVQVLEKDLISILNEKSNCLRTFRSALDVIRIEMKEKIQDKKTCRIKIEKYIHEVNIYYTMGNSPARNEKLRDRIIPYLFWLIAYLYQDEEALSTRKIVEVIYPRMKEVFNGTEDIRVHLSQLNNDMIFRLLKNLFEICQLEQIELHDNLTSTILSEYL